jgi:hypothetical protein
MNMKKIMALACMALALFTAGTSMADDNTGSGGTITYTDAGGLNPVASPPYAGGYVVHTFTNSDTLNIPVPASADVLVVGGGGGGGGNPGGSWGAGGGAGGLIYSNAFSIAANSNYTVTVGVGGGASSTPGGTGTNSVFGSLTALGGGGGGGAGAAGGSGGGAWSGAGGSGQQPGSSSGGYGNNGGGGPGGGGGGAGAAGGSGYGPGGIGREYSISGVAAYYAGGGDPAGNNSVVLGGGGRAGVIGAVNGVANTGGGGAGCQQNLGVAPGSGGSGIVIVRYPYALLGAPPTLFSIVDNKSGGPIVPNTLVTYTVTFNKDMDANTVSDSDFENAGSATISFGTVTETSLGVFTVPVTPTTGGSLRLQIKAGADLKDADGIALVTTSALPDDTTITVDATAPTLAGSGIVDDKSGGPVWRDTLVTYTVTFSKDMDASTVSASDFGNAGTAAVTIGTVTEPSPGVFTVPVTPTGDGTLQLKVNVGAALNDAVGNALDTTSDILDDTTITVVAPPGNTGSGGTITYTDSNGLNPVATPPYVPYIGGYVVHTFTSSGTLNIPVPASADVLVVAGGGAGGGGPGAGWGAGGGAGGLIYSTAFSIAANSNYTVTVGVGGGTSSLIVGNGTNSVFGSLTALGGGRGSNTGAGYTGGSGGGAWAGYVVGASGLQPGSASGGYGNNGGAPYGGGGGAGAAGTSGLGGIGREYSISGVAAYYAGGGGGPGDSTVVPGGGGRMGATSGVANTGGGGAGGHEQWGVVPGSGGSGIVIVRYPYTPPPPSGTLISFF